MERKSLKKQGAGCWATHPQREHRHPRLRIRRRASEARSSIQQHDFPKNEQNHQFANSFPPLGV